MEPGEVPAVTAIREFKEETGLALDDVTTDMLIPLGWVKQSSIKTVIAYGLHYPDIEPDRCISNLCPDGVTPEIDRYRWMTFSELKNKTHPKHINYYIKLLEIKDETFNNN